MSDAEIPKPPRAGGWPVGFLGMLAVVVAVEVGLNRSGREITPLAAADWRKTGEAAAGEAAHAEILCFGDSLVKTGVVPEVLQRRLGLSAYNLAVLGGPPPASYALLRRALDAGAKPKAIVLDAKASVLGAADYRANLRDWSELLAPRDAVDLARTDRDLGLVGEYLLHRYVPSVRLRLDLRKAILDQTAGVDPSTAIAWPSIVDRQQGLNRGAVFRAPTHPKGSPDPFPGGALPWHEATVCYPSTWTPRPTNLVYLDRFLKLAESRSIPVFLLVPPIHPGVQAERERRGLDASYTGLIAGIGDRYPNVVVVDGRKAGYGHEFFVDSHHLDLEGATAQTRALADVIASRLAAPQADRASRWVALPAVSGPAPQVAAEDLGASQRAVREVTTRR